MDQTMRELAGSHDLFHRFEEAYWGEQDRLKRERLISMLVSLCEIRFSDGAAGQNG